MRRSLVAFAVLALLLPMVGEGQSIKYYPAGGGGSVVTVATNSTAVATSGTAAEVLHTLTLPAGSLAEAGDYVDVSATFSHAANGNARTTALRLTNAGGTVLIAIASSSSGISTLQTVRFIRTGASTALSLGTTTNTSAIALTTSTVAHTGLDFDAPLIFCVVGTTGVAAGDLTATSSKLTLTTD